MLDSLIQVRKRLVNTSMPNINLLGEIEVLTVDLISHIGNIGSAITSPSVGGEIIRLRNISDFLGDKICLEINLGYFDNYFEDFEDFLKRYKYNSPTGEYYIYSENISANDADVELMKSYRINLKILDFFESIADNSNLSGGVKTFYFHRPSTNLILPVDYTKEDLLNSKISNSTDFISRMQNGLHVEDRTKLFVIELINIYKGQTKDYSFAIRNWSMLEINFLHSYDVYLEGFSFDKVKTSSLQHFQDLTDKIHDTIQKISNYLFGIPVAFIFLASRLEYNQAAPVKNLGLLALGYLFTAIIWNVFFENIKESLDSIKKEIERFEDKIKNTKELDNIKSELYYLKSETLQKHYDKLVILKAIIVFIVIVMTFLVFYILNTKS